MTHYPNDDARRAHNAAKARYDQTHTQRVALKLNLKTDADILERLEKEDSVQGYIKRLIREDIARNGG